MGGGVILPGVSLRLGYAPPEDRTVRLPAAQEHADDGPGHGDGVPFPEESDGNDGSPSWYGHVQAQPALRLDRSGVQVLEIRQVRPDPVVRREVAHIVHPAADTSVLEEPPDAAGSLQVYATGVEALGVQIFQQRGRVLLQMPVGLRPSMRVEIGDAALVQTQEQGSHVSGIDEDDEKPVVQRVGLFEIEYGRPRYLGPAALPDASAHHVAVSEYSQAGDLARYPLPHQVGRRMALQALLSGGRILGGEFGEQVAEAAHVRESFGSDISVPLGIPSLHAASWMADGRINK